MLGYKPEYRRTKSGSSPTSSGKKPPPPDLPRQTSPAGTFFTPDALRRKKASSHWFRRGNALPLPDAPST